MNKHVTMIGVLAAMLLAAAPVLAAEGPPPEVLTPSEYWIGVECYPAGEALAAQLKLAEGQGLVVENVLPESPAGKAGIQRHDVLVEAGGKPLGSIADLVAAIDEAKENAMKVGLVREGARQTVEVVPERRPTDAAPGDVPSVREWQRLRDLFERTLPGEGVRGPGFRYHVFGPGIVLPPGAAERVPLPSGLSVAVTRVGDEPARIVVQRGDEKWEVTEEELGKLPDDVRPHVEAMLGRVPGLGVDIDVKPQVREWPMPRLPEIRERLVPPPLPRVEQHLKEMERRIEELRRDLERLRGGAAEEVPSPENAPSFAPGTATEL